MVFSLFRPSVWMATGLVAVFTTVAAYLHQPAVTPTPPLLPNPPAIEARVAVVKLTPLAEESNPQVPPSPRVELPEVVPPPLPAEESNPTVPPGLVRWHPSFAAAQEAARSSGKPVLLFHMLGRLDRQFC